MYRNIRTIWRPANHEPKNSRKQGIFSVVWENIYYVTSEIHVYSLHPNENWLNSVKKKLNESKWSQMLSTSNRSSAWVKISRIRDEITRTAVFPLPLTFLLLWLFFLALCGPCRSQSAAALNFNFSSSNGLIKNVIFAMCEELILLATPQTYFHGA